MSPSVDVDADRQGGRAAELLWSACASLGAADRSLLVLHLRHRVTAEQLAPDLGLDARRATVHLEALVDRFECVAIETLAWPEDSAGASAILAELPVVPTGSELTRHVATQLASAGVPMTGSRHLTAPVAPT